MSTQRRRKSGTSSRQVSSKRSPRKKVESGQHAGHAGLELQSYEVAPAAGQCLAGSNAIGRNLGQASAAG